MFADRNSAGEQLGEQLAQSLPEGRSDLLVLALPRGGVPVAWPVARRLQAPLDVLVVRKLGAPGQPELALGAIAGEGVTVLNDELISRLRISEGQVRQVRELEERELSRRLLTYRGDRPAPVLTGRWLVLVDDGLATGATMRAAVQAVRTAAPSGITVAVPVGSKEAVAEFERIADQVECLHAPESLSSIGLWYRDFSQTTDGEVTELLSLARSGNG